MVWADAVSVPFTTSRQLKVKKKEATSLSEQEKGNWRRNLFVQLVLLVQSGKVIIFFDFIRSHSRTRVIHGENLFCTSLSGNPNLRDGENSIT